MRTLDKEKVKMLGQPDMVPVLVRLKEGVSKPLIDAVIALVIGLIQAMAQIDFDPYLGTLELKNVKPARLYLQFNIPKAIFDAAKAAITIAHPSIVGFQVNQRIRFEYPTDASAVIPIDKAFPRRGRGMSFHPQILDSRKYLEVDKIWSHPRYKEMDTCLVVVVDTGISQGDGKPWPCLGDRLVAAKNFAYSSNRETDDEIGHGSFCAMIIGAGEWEDKPDYRGLFPKVLLASAKIFDGDGMTWESWILEALDWAAGLEVTYKGKKYRTKVINNSWGSNQNNDGTDEISKAADDIWKAGIYCEFSMGNNGQNKTAPCEGSVGAPATNKLCAKTGATSGAKAIEGSTQSLVMSFSSRPPTKDGRSYPELRFCVGPGYQINGYEPRMNGKSGTSFSGPIHSAVAALLICAYTILFTNDAVWKAIASTCWKMGYRDQYGESSGACIEGAGEIRPLAAFKKAAGDDDGNGDDAEFVGTIETEIDNMAGPIIDVKGDGSYATQTMVFSVGDHFYHGTLYDLNRSLVDKSAVVHFTVKKKEDEHEPPERELQAKSPTEGEVLQEGEGRALKFEVKEKQG